MMTVSDSLPRGKAALLAVIALAAFAVQFIAPSSAVAALGPPVFGPPTQTARIGSATGTPASADCPSPAGVSEVLGGITATINTLAWLSKAQAVCADLITDPNEVTLGTFEGAGSVAGFRPPAQYASSPASQCPENAVVVGIQGRGGALVDGVQVLCRALRADGTLDENLFATSYAGGVGGAAQGPFMCPTNAVATGIIGQIGEDLDSLGLTCRVLGFPSTAPEDINVTWPTALVVSGTSTTAGAITTPGQERWYRFPVLPGSRVQVDLTGVPADYDLTLFKDISQAFTTLTTTADLTQLSAEFAADAFSPSAFSPSVFSPSAFSPSAFSPSAFSPSAFSPSAFSPSAFSPSAFSPSAFSPSAFSPSAFSPSAFSPAVSLPSAFSPSAFSPSTFSQDVFAQAFSSAQTRSLIAVSARDGTAPESISSATWTNTGFFYVRVSGRNGASSPTPYTVAVTTSGGPCDAPLADYANESTIVGSPGAAQTVILTDPQRLPGTPTDEAALQQNLAALAAATDGVVIDLADSDKVSALNAQADSSAFVSCPYAKNLVAQSVRDIVNSYRDSQGTLRYVVIVGDDSVVPFFRYADSAGLGPESDYVPPVADSTASQASLRSNYVLSQDAYGAATDISVKGALLPVSDLAVGRLVETPTEISGLVAGFLDGGSVLEPTTTLTTGYDFLTDAADSVAATFAGGIPGGQHDQLITDADVPPTTTTIGGVPDRAHSWTAEDLREELFGSRHDLTFLAGHFSANSTLAADYDTTVLSTEVLATPREVFENTLIFSAGCHSGYTIVDGEGIPGVTVGLDWTQAFARQGATLIAGTGYQYGDTDFLEYSERLYADFAQELRVGSGPVSVGAALTAAKQSYLATTPTLRGIDTKAVLEATLYGLPMFSVDLPAAGRIDPPQDDPLVTPAAVSGGPGSVLGLQVGQLNLSPALETVTTSLSNVEGGGSVTATHLVGPAGVETNPAEPALPLVSANVSAPGQVLRGVGFRGGTYFDMDGITPLTGAPATETHSVHTPFLSPAFFPPRLAYPNYFDALGAADGGTTRLMVTPAQHRSDGSGSLTTTLRSFSALGLRLYYNANIQTYGENVPALAAAPTMTGIDAESLPDGSVAFQAHVVGDPSAGIQEVWVSYTSERGGPLHGQWISLDLVQDPADSTLWTGSFLPPPGQDPAAIRYVVQAANGVGLVGLDDNQGRYFTPGVTAGAVDPEAVDTTLTLSGIPTGGSYGADIPVSARLTDGAGAGVAGRLVTFNLGGSSRTAVTDENGVAVAELPLSVVPGAYALTASFDGDADFASTASSPLSFEVSKQATSLSLIREGTSLTATLLGDSGLPLREKTVFFAATNSAGTVLGGTAVITDLAGAAELDTGQLPSGTVAVTAYFGSATTPLPGGATADLSDPSYAPSTSSTVVLNSAPTATADSYTVVGGGVLSVPAPGVLANDSDPQGDPLQVTRVSGPANGGLTLRPDGSFTYTPNGDFVGIDSFTYTANDGTLTSAPVTVTITVTEPRPPGCTIVGTPGNDVLQGGNGKDVICGLGGNDVLNGSNGDDILYGGSGDDRLDGSNGRDTLQGASGNDTLLGSNDDDTMSGGSGNDLLDGSNGNDTIVAGSGVDQLVGSNGNDTLDAIDGAGGDSINGGNGTDTCRRDAGDTQTGCP